MAISDELRDRLARALPVEVPAIPCADCIPSVDGLRVEHADTCPFMIEIERITGVDRQWFEDHPGAQYYYRPVTWAEGSELLLNDARTAALPPDVHLSPAGKVRVEQIRPGERARTFEDVYFVA